MNTCLMKTYAPIRRTVEQHFYLLSCDFLIRRRWPLATIRWLCKKRNEVLPATKHVFNVTWNTDRIVNQTYPMIAHTKLNRMVNILRTRRTIAILRKHLMSRWLLSFQNMQLNLNIDHWNSTFSYQPINDEQRRQISWKTNSSCSWKIGD